MECYIENIHKSFDSLEVLKGLSIHFKENQVTCILGPSGCGKSTLLNIIMAVLEPETGKVVGFEGKDISTIFQEDRLIEWRSVEDNIDFVLRNKLGYAERRKIIHDYLEAVGLSDYRNYFPRKLSGGMRQRVSIVRAFAYPSEIMIMDEPFKSLDVNMKANLMKTFCKLRQNDDRTVIYVTHDVDEAVTLGDQIVILTDKPAMVKRVFENPIKQNCRWEKTQEIEDLKREIIGEFMEEVQDEPPITLDSSAATGAEMD